VISQGQISGNIVKKSGKIRNFHTVRINTASARFIHVTFVGSAGKGSGDVSCGNITKTPNSIKDKSPSSTKQQKRGKAVAAKKQTGSSSASMKSPQGGGAVSTELPKVMTVKEFASVTGVRTKIENRIRHHFIRDNRFQFPDEGEKSEFEDVMCRKALQDICEEESQELFRRYKDHYAHYARRCKQLDIVAKDMEQAIGESFVFDIDDEAPSYKKNQTAVSTNQKTTTAQEAVNSNGARNALKQQQEASSSPIYEKETRNLKAQNTTQSKQQSQQGVVQSAVKQLNSLKKSTAVPPQSPNALQQPNLQGGNQYNIPNQQRLTAPHSQTMKTQQITTLPHSQQKYVNSSNQQVKSERASPSNMKVKESAVSTPSQEGKNQQMSIPSKQQTYVNPPSGSNQQINQQAKPSFSVQAQQQQKQLQPKTQQSQVKLFPEKNGQSNLQSHQAQIKNPNRAAENNAPRDLSAPESQNRTLKATETPPSSPGVRYLLPNDCSKKIEQNTGQGPVQKPSDSRQPIKQPSTKINVEKQNRLLKKSSLPENLQEVKDKEQVTPFDLLTPKLKEETERIWDKMVEQLWEMIKLQEDDIEKQMEKNTTESTTDESNKPAEVKKKSRKSKRARLKAKEEADTTPPARSIFVKVLLPSLDLVKPPDELAIANYSSESEASETGDEDTVINQLVSSFNVANDIDKPVSSASNTTENLIFNQILETNAYLSSVEPEETEDRGDEEQIANLTNQVRTERSLQRAVLQQKYDDDLQNLKKEVEMLHKKMSSFSSLFYRRPNSPSCLQEVIAFTEELQLTPRRPLSPVSQTPSTKVSPPESLYEEEHVVFHEELSGGQFEEYGDPMPNDDDDYNEPNDELDSFHWPKLKTSCPMKKEDTAVIPATQTQSFNSVVGSKPWSKPHVETVNERVHGVKSQKEAAVAVHSAQSSQRFQGKIQNNAYTTAPALNPNNYNNVKSAFQDEKTITNIAKKMEQPASSKDGPMVLYLTTSKKDTKDLRQRRSEAGEESPAKSKDGKGKKGKGVSLFLAGI